TRRCCRPGAGAGRLRRGGAGPHPALREGNVSRPERHRADRCPAPGTARPHAAAKGRLTVMTSGAARGIAMTASTMRLRRSAFSWLLGFGLLVATALLAYSAILTPAWSQAADAPAATGPTGGEVPGN